MIFREAPDATKHSHEIFLATVVVGSWQILVTVHDEVGRGQVHRGALVVCLLADLSNGRRVAERYSTPVIDVGHLIDSELQKETVDNVTYLGRHSKQTESIMLDTRVKSVSATQRQTGQNIRSLNHLMSSFIGDEARVRHRLFRVSDDLGGDQLHGILGGAAIVSACVSLGEHCLGTHGGLPASALRGSDVLTWADAGSVAMIGVGEDGVAEVKLVSRSSCELDGALCW